MKKLNILSILLVACISSFFFVNKVDALFKVTTDSKVNTFTLTDKGNYVAIHKQMDLDGEYTIIDSPNDEGEELLGTEVTPPVRSYTGFKQPEEQTIIIDFGTKEIIYLYEREKYYLTIENEENVTTNTHSGQYYYGTSIYLLADETDSQGREFKRWSDGSTDLGITFTMTQDVTIKPIYGDPYIIEFETNGGSPAIASRDVDPGTAIGALPVVTRDDCELSEGSYDDRNCTYAYKFLGWYKEPEFVNKVNESFVPTGNMTLYAKWTKVYYHDDEEIFNGTNYLDTEIALFSQENADKDFIVRFTLDAMDANQGVGNEKRAVLFSDLYENGPIFPGAMFRYDTDNKIKDFQIVANAAAGDNTYGGRMTTTVSDFEVGMSFVLKRVDGILYYSIDGGTTFIQYNDFSSFNNYFNIYATFGAEYNKNNHTVYRYFKGTLSDMTVEITEPKTYNVHYDANGGTGMMLDQEMRLNKPYELTANSFERPWYKFSHWNTSPDGTGTSYQDGATVSGLGGANEVVTLYAQWVDAPHYTVHFEANGGTGTMEDQELVYSIRENLTMSGFSKEGFVFDSWNTKANGTGTRYDDGEEVLNLSSTEGDVITLYAQYGSREFHYDGEITFDGTNYLDTGVNIYNVANLDKDFTIEYDIISISDNLLTGDETQPTIMNAKDEDNIISESNEVPGFVTRIQISKKNNVNVMELRTIGRWGNTKNELQALSPDKAPIHVKYTRTDGAVRATYTYEEDGVTKTITKVLYDQDNWELNKHCATNIVFGATYINGTPTRFFKGTLANISVVVDE